MNTMIYGLLLMLISATSAALAYVLGWFLTEVITLPIAVKPFNCRGCLTFWLTVIIGTVMYLVAPIHHLCDDAVTLLRIVLICANGITALCLYFYIQSKFKIYD